MLQDLHTATSTSTIEPKPVTASRPSRPAESFDIRGKHIYFIGIGGSGMSGLAQMFEGRGGIIRGSDRDPSDVTAAMTAFLFSKEAQRGED